MKLAAKGTYSNDKLSKNMSIGATLDLAESTLCNNKPLRNKNTGAALDLAEVRGRSEISRNCLWHYRHSLTVLQ